MQNVEIGHTYRVCTPILLLLLKSDYIACTELASHCRHPLPSEI